MWNEMMHGVCKQRDFSMDGYIGYAKRETLSFTLCIFTCFFIVCYQVNMSKPCYHGNGC